MQRIIDAFVAKGFMGAVLAVKGTQTLIDEAYGFADLEWNIPNVNVGKFRIGSITKQFTAASVLLLEERGKLKIEDPVIKYLSDAPAQWGKITVFNLLTHTSGIPSFTDFPDYEATKWKDTNPHELVSRFIATPLEFEPGTMARYSNSGYVLLGLLVEKISGRSFGEFLRQNIFAPLGMADTAMDDNSNILPRRVKGYLPSTSGLKPANYISMTIPYSAGALYSTTGDLLKWQRGLFGGKVLAPVSLTKMTKPYKDNYALGLFIQTKNGHKVIYHGGGIDGFNSSVMFYPRHNLVVSS